MIRTETGENRQIMDLTPAFRDSTLERVVEAYRNPRLENPESDYLNPEHIAELRDHSESYWGEPSAPEVIPGVGTIHRVSIVTKQGYGYKGVWGEPEVQRTDSLGLATSPLGTSAEGYNRHVMLNYLRTGNYVGFLAGEGSHRPDMVCDTKTRISLANSAAALLNFGYHLRTELAKRGHDIHEENRFAYGASRAGAIALLLNTLDEEFVQNIRASDVIAPSPALRFDSKEQWQQVGEQLLKEPAHTAFIISRLGLKLALRYRKTVSFDTYNLAHQLEICGGLFNGELDAAASHIPREKIIRVTEYDCDLACNDGGLEERLSPATHPNVTFEQLGGIHMSIVDRNKTLPVMMGFNKAYQEFESGKLANAEELIIRARDLAPRQFPITQDQVPHSTQPQAA